MSRWIMFAVVSCAMCMACGDDGGTGDGSTGDGSTMDGTTGDGSTGDGSTMDGTTGDGSTGDGSTGDGATGDGATGDGATGDGGSGPCVVIECQGHIRECGDCIDNEAGGGDGLVDQRDPDCLGPCDNNESGFYADIPGSPPTNCGRDCYYDQDDGPGNDTCEWDFQCDRLEPGPLRCEYTDPPHPSANCPDPQTDECHDICGPLTPNGCDCFGCCELPGGSDNFVYVGTYDPDTREGTCNLASAADVDACHPCTPVADCLNTCERCEICLGRTAADLPADCFPPPPMDAGTPPDASVTDGGTPPDTSTPPPPTCADGRQACDVPGAGPCPATYFCITGCCTFFG